MATIKDLAKYCNVSISTVSYALNDSKEVSAETKERIKKAAEELNYVPNAYARGLKNKLTYNIGVFLSGFEGPIHHTILSGIAKVLTNVDCKYNMIVTLSDNKMLLIKEKSVDLAIIMDSRVEVETINELSKIVPIITFDNEIYGKNIYNTKIDNTNGIYLQTINLINKGCKRIAYMLGSKHSYHNRKRFEGYVKAFEEKKMPLDKSIVFDADAFTEQRGFEVINEIVSQNNKLTFDSLICANDELAIGAINALTKHGYNVPKDIKVAGFDNIEKGNYVYPTLSTVKVDWKFYGEEMAKLALEILANKKTKDIDIPVEIIERDSTKILV